MKKQELFANIPKVDNILEADRIQAYLKENSKEILKKAIDITLDALRNDIKALSEDAIATYDISFQHILDQIFENIRLYTELNLRKVVNGTGVVVHTNLGRSSLGKVVAKEVYEVASNYSNLEFDLTSGGRGHRYDHIESLICEITNAEGALVVNNNAAAVMLALDTLAKDKEGIVSRGELVEIGGSFRVPDVMRYSGTKLVEVGTTNKTHLRDYEHAINENTGVLMKVHTSNYRVVGFTDAVNNAALVDLGKKYDIPVLEDLGSGLLIDFSKYSSIDEPTVQSSIEQGVDVVTFSGDKLLGGPQAGIIVGKKEYIEKMKYNQLTRALRIDKMTLVALEASLRQYLDPALAVKNIPTLRNIFIDKEALMKKAQELKAVLDEIEFINCEISPDKSQVGGGSLPLKRLDTFVLTITSRHHSTEKLAKALRLNDKPVVGRIKNDALLLDLRTIERDEFEWIKESFMIIEKEIKSNE